MRRKRNTDVTQEEINKLLEEKRKEYEKQHTAWILLRNGYTYVGYNIQDHITESSMQCLMQLIGLMRLEYSIKYPLGNNEEYYLVIDGEDEARAEFIQKFFDNGYKLSW